MSYLPPGQPSHHLDYPDAVVGDIPAGSARRFPDRVALRDGIVTVTYAQLYEQSLRIAAGLRANGIQPGDVVALHQPNSVWFPVSYFGVMLSGAVVSLVNPGLPAVALADHLAEVGAVAVITHATSVPTLRAAAPPSVRLTVVVDGADDNEAEIALARLLDHEPAEPAKVRPDDLAQLSFTGGTTGRSKAVRMLHRNLVCNVLQVICWRAGARPVQDPDGGLGIEAIPEAQTPYTNRLGEEATIGLAPLFHVMGLISTMGNLLVGTEITMIGRFDPAQFVRTIEERRITSFPGSPAMYHALLRTPGIDDADLSSVRVVASGAAPTDTTTQARVAKLFPNAIPVEGYGLTEATAALALHPTVAGDVVPKGSVGAPVFDTEISIRQIGGGPEVPVGEVGEVWAAGPQVSDGYLGHPELTAAQFQDGWLCTGDLGRLDEDGWLFIVGRSKDMLIYKGYNVYPGSLEEVLTEHTAVAQASVVGAPDPEVGEIPVAYVTLRHGHTPSSELSDELMAYVAERVAPYSRIRRVVFLDELPTSAAGKILKTELRKMPPPADAEGPER